MSTGAVEKNFEKMRSLHTDTNTVGSGNRRQDSAVSLGVLSNNVISEIKTAQSLQPTSKIPKAKRLGTQSLIKVSKVSNQRVIQKPTPLSNTHSSNASIVLTHAHQSKKASLLSPSSVDHAKKAYNSKPIIGRYQMPSGLKPPISQLQQQH